MPGANANGTAIGSDIVGDAAQVCNIQPVTDFPTTADYLVTNLSGLNSALSSAVAGDTIELAPGSYGLWTPQKINTTTEANHETNKIRIFCRNSPFLNSDANSAIFDNIELDNTPGCTGLSIENVKMNSFRAEGANIGFIDVIGSMLTYFRLTYSTGRMRLMHSIGDRNYSENSNGANVNFLDADLYVQNCMFIRAGGDNFQIQQTGPNGKIYVWDSVFWDQFVDNPLAHPDLIQGVNARSVDIRRVFLWQEPNIPNNKGAQGIALGDGVHASDCVIEDCFTRNDLGRKISCTSYKGIVDNCCTVGAIYMSNRNGGGANALVTNTVSSNFIDDDLDGPYRADPFDAAQNNNDYGDGNEDAVFLNSSGDYRSWRDYLPATGDRTNGGIAYLRSLETIWDGVVATPPTLPATVTLAVTVG